MPSTGTGVPDSPGLCPDPGPRDTVPMENWPGQFELIEIRKKSSRDQEFWADQERYYHLTAEIAVTRKKFDGLKPWERSIALCAAVGLTVDRAIVAGRAAALLWGIKVLTWDRTVELMHTDGKQAGAAGTWPPNVRHRRCNLRSDEVHEEHGLRVTLATRALRDIAAHHGVLEGLVAMDSARSQWPHLTKEYLRQELVDGARFNGIGKVRDTIALSVPNAGSPLETKARYLIVTSDLPGVQTIEAQARINRGPGAGHFDVDLLINGWLVIELDGRFKLDGTTFGKTDAALRAERNREVFIQNTGKRFIRAGWEHLEPQSDGEIPLLTMITEALRTHIVPATS